MTSTGGERGIVARIKSLCDWLQLFFLLSLVFQAVKLWDIDSTILQLALYEYSRHACSTSLWFQWQGREHKVQSYGLIILHANLYNITIAYLLCDAEKSVIVHCTIFRIAQCIRYTMHRHVCGLWTSAAHTVGGGKKWILLMHPHAWAHRLSYLCDFQMVCMVHSRSFLVTLTQIHI